MFTTNHFIWLAVCAVCIAAGLGYLINRRPRLSSVLTAFCLVCIASECVKVLSCIEMVPGKDGQTMYPYLPLAHLPFHLCSIQIAFIFYTRFSHNERLRTALLAFMYPSCLAGAMLALLMPSIVPGSVAVEDMFRAPLAYQYFLYHSALIVLGAYIPLSGEVGIKPKHYLSSLGILLGLGFASIYLNSAFASPRYENGELVGLDYVTNFFFTYEPPFDLGISEKWQWMLYAAAIALLAAAVTALLYAPYFVKAKRAKSRERG